MASSSVPPPAALECTRFALLVNEKKKLRVPMNWTVHMCPELWQAYRTGRIFLMNCSTPDNYIPEWTDSFMFILPTGSTRPVCLICSDCGTHKKCQCETSLWDKAQSFWPNIPTQVWTWSQKSSSLRAQYEQSTPILTHSFTAQQRANECSPFFSLTWEEKKHIYSIMYHICIIISWVTINIVEMFLKCSFFIWFDHQLLITCRCWYSY